MEGWEWRKLFPPKILERGEDYYVRGQVKALARAGDLVSAIVGGGQDYQVELAFQGKLLEEWQCSCPYGQNGAPCKHLAAVFLALECGGRA